MKIVCIGDSLTSGFGVFKDKRWTELMIKNHKLNIINKGINGDTTTGMLCRFFDDVLSLKPSLAIIMGGCNDFISNRSLRNTEINMEEMVLDALSHNIIPIPAIEIPLIEEMAKRKWRQDADYAYVTESSLLYRNWILKFSESKGLNCIDFYRLFQEKLNSYSTRELYIDGIHPTALGHKFMAEEAIRVVSQIHVIS
jgi:acyl-CoA thioesterase-1